MLEPYNSGIVADLLHTCCGACVNVSTVEILTKVSQVSSPATSNSHFVFPVLGRSDVLMLYGYRFIPLIEAPGAYYITNKSEDLMPQLILSCLNLWPLMVICFFMVVISGFIGWFLETWDNREEFPRAFLIGWFEGFWWSFISMTTVGYGDKVPKSILARLFSVIWIVIGITTFSLVTAMLSSEITAANSSPPPVMEGSKVGAIQHRLYDAILIGKHGGVLVDIEATNTSDGIHQLVTKLKTNEIDGFVLDRYTLLLYYRHFGNNTTHKDDIAFLKKKTVLSEMIYEGSQFSYGVLVKNIDDYEFLVDFVMDNRDVINTCNNLYINNHNIEGKKVRNLLFSASAGTIWSSYITTSITIVLICSFGITYEMWRRKVFNTAKSDFV